MDLSDDYKIEIRNSPIFFWAFALAFISCAFIACFLTLAQLVMYDFPKWADYSMTLSALVFTYISVTQGRNFYKIKKQGLYYFLAIHCITFFVVLGLLIRDIQVLYLMVLLFITGIVVLQYKLIRMVNNYYELAAAKEKT
jgi:hypothetical protein